MKKIILIIFTAISCIGVPAQVSHEVSIHGGGGLSTLYYKLPDGTRLAGGGGEFGIGYTCFFNKYIGVHLGADIAFYNAKAKLDGLKVVSSNLTDNEGDIFDMHTTLSKYSETQKSMFLNIPIMAHIQTKRFYALGGVKMGIPLQCNHNASDVTIDNKGYYPEYNNWITDVEFQGYGTFSNINSSEKLPFKIAASLAFETGIKYNFGKNFALFVGIYFDYGLNNIVKKGDHPFINYNTNAPANFTTNSAIPSLVERINPMALGVKVRFAFIK